ncbi:MAG: hypothetical protein ACI4D8_04495 [Wujia sp.]
MQKKLFKILGIVSILSLLCTGCGNKNKYEAGTTEISSSTDGKSSSDSSENNEVVDANTDVFKEYSGRYVATSIIAENTVYTPEEYFEVEDITLSINIFSDGTFIHSVITENETSEYKGRYLIREDGKYSVLYDVEDPETADEENEGEYFVISDDNVIKYFIEGAEIDYVQSDDKLDNKAIVGDYTLIGMRLDTKFYSLDELLELGVSINGTMSVRDDGTFSFEFEKDGEEKPDDGTWKFLGADLYSFEESGIALIVTFNGIELELETSENASYVFALSE